MQSRLNSNYWERLLEFCLMKENLVAEVVRRQGRSEMSEGKQVASCAENYRSKDNHAPQGHQVHCQKTGKMKSSIFL